GTLFDLTTPHETVINQFNIRVARILGPQSQRAAVINDYTNDLLPLRTALNTIRGSDPLKRVIAAIEASTDAVIAAQLRQWRSGLDIVRLDDAHAAGRAIGSEPLQVPSVPFDGIWLTDQLVPY